MKKIISLFTCCILMIGLFGCQNTKEEPKKVEKEPRVEETSHLVLVVYFSVTGNTKQLAEYASDYLEADIFEIEAFNPYTDEDIDYGNSNSRTSIEQNDETSRPEISNTVEDMDKYDVIALGYPIWWAQAPRIIDTFLESYDFSNKTIIPFCTSASSDIGTSDDNLHSLVDNSVTWKEGKRFAQGTSKEEFINWLNEVLSKN